MSYGFESNLEKGKDGQLNEKMMIEELEVRVGLGVLVDGVL